MPKNTIPLAAVKSAKIAAIGHDASTQTLAVQFTGNGAVYNYAGFSAEAFEQLQAAESVGKHFNAHVIGKFDHTLMKAEAPAPAATEA